jgi:hypothetical protein
MKSLSKLSLCCIAVLFLFLAGCKPDATTSTTAMLMLHLHTNIDTNEVDPGTSYHNWAGRNVQLTRAQYYLSNFVLTRTDGSTVNVNGRILNTWGTEEYMVGNIPTGTYKSISFRVGVDAANNHTDPAAHVSTDVLATQSPSMHFVDLTTGYIFMAVEGLVDSSAAGTGTPTKTFSYHIGTDALLGAVTMGDHSVWPYTVYTATAGSSMTVHLIADYGKLFNGIDMNANNVTNTTDNLPLATSLAHNISSMFIYED